MTLVFSIPYLILAFFVIRSIVRKEKTIRGKWIKGLLTAFAFYIPLGWDVILGRAYFNYVCAKQGGVHVYQTVELGPEFYHEDGKPKFVTARGAFDGTVFDGRYIFTRESDRNFSKTFNIGDYVNKVIDINKNEVLGDKTSFIYYGGWFMKYTGFHVKGTSCRSYSRGVERVLEKEFLNYIFIKN